MQIQNIPTENLVEYARNPRKNDAVVDKMVACIKEFGFRIPIVAKSDGTVVDGHLRLKAARKMGLKEVPVVNADDLTEAQIKAFRLVANQSANWAEWDEELLKLEFKDLEDLNFDLELTGFDLEEIEKYLDNQETENKWEANNPGALSERFLISPFDIWDARKGEWQKRKKIWNLKIGDDGSARVGAVAFTKNLTKISKKLGTSILDPVLSEVINSWFSPYSGCKVFDCFAGDTVFGFVSAYLGNHFTGVELRQEQADFNNARVQGMTAKYICDDGRNIDKHLEKDSQDLLFSCPPYFDLEIYSDLPNDASNQNSYEDFLSILDEAFSKAITCLKDNRFAVIVVGDIRKKGNDSYYNFPGDIVNIFRKNGLILYNNIKLLTPLGTAPYRASIYMRNRKTVHVYQDVLVFYKGDTSKIKEIFGDIEVAELEAEDESTDF